MSAEIASITSNERKLGIREKLAALKNKAALAAGEPTDPAFQDSFGDQLSDLDGRHRWVLVGLALQKWHRDLRDRVGEVLRENEGEIYKGRSIRNTTTLRHCWMMGYDRTSAHPTVVISCDQTTILKRTMRAISQHGVLKAAKFALKGVPFCDLRLRMESGRELSEDTKLVQYDLDSSDDEELPLRFGAEEIIAPHSGKSTTLGGYLMVDDVCFGLTTAHAFTEDDELLEQQSLPDKEPDLQLYDSDWANEESDDDANVSVRGTDGTPKASQEQRLQRRRKRKVANDSTYEASNGDALPITAKSRLLSANGLDWALCGLGALGKYSVNGVFLPPELRGADGLEYLIFKEIKSTPPVGKVLVATRKGGAITGLGTGSECSIKLDRDDKYRHVWSIQVDQSLSSGDSGSWVVDAATGEVYGIILAGSTILGEEYVMPAFEIGQDIKRVLRADTVTLPLLEDVMAARAAQMSIRQTAKDSMIDSLAWDSDDSTNFPEEQSLGDEEKRFLLAEVLKTSSIDTRTLSKAIKDAGIRPEWTKMTLPKGQSLRTAQRAVDRLLSDTWSTEDITEDQWAFTRPGLQQHHGKSYIREISASTRASVEGRSRNDKSDDDKDALAFEDPPELLDSNPSFRAEMSRRAWRAKRRAEQGSKAHHRKHRPRKSSGEVPRTDPILKGRRPLTPQKTKNQSKLEVDLANEQGRDDPDVLILKHKGSTYIFKFPPSSMADGSLLIGDLRQRAAKEFGAEAASRVSLVYRGKSLKFDTRACQEEGLRYRSEVLCVIKRTPSEELEFLSNKLRAELIPQGLEFISNTPEDIKKRDFEYNKISETILTQIIMKSDAVDTEGDENARNMRKELAKEAQGFLDDLDLAANKDSPAAWHADFIEQKQESGSFPARPSFSDKRSFGPKLHRSSTKDGDDQNFGPDEG